MKKTILVFTVSALGMGLFWYFKKGQDTTTPSILSTETSTRVETKPKRKSIRSIRYVVSNPEKVTTAFPKECHASIIDLSSRSIEEFMDLIKEKETLRSFFGESCLSELKNNKMASQFVKTSNCNLFEKKGAVEDSCISLLLMFKAHFISEQTNGKPIEKMSPEEIAANVANLFFSFDNLKKEDFPKNVQLFDALKNLYPNDPSVTEAYLGYLLIGKQITKDNSVDSKIDETFQESEGEAFKVDRMKVIRDVIGGDFSAAKASLDQLHERYPNEPDVSYYYASYYWKQGNKKMAESYLDQAIKLSENCNGCTPGVYRDSRTKMHNGTAVDQIFTLSIGLNFENL